MLLLLAGILWYLIQGENLTNTFCLKVVTYLAQSARWGLRESEVVS